MDNNTNHNNIDGNNSGKDGAGRNAGAQAPEVRVAIPSILRPFVSGPAKARRGDLILQGHDLREVLAELAKEHPQVYVRLCDEQGNPRQHIGVFVNDDHIRALSGLDSKLVAGDLVSLLPAVSGG